MYLVRGFARSGRLGLRLARPLEQRMADVRDHQIHFVAGDAEVRREAQRVGAAVDHADAVLAHEFLGGTGAVALEARVEFAGEQQAGALHLGDQAAAVRP